MKLTTPFTALINATSDMWRIHNFNHKLPKEAKQDFWEKECTIIQLVITAIFIKEDINSRH
tara:strand:- start:75 stop:257 length:183 start_codon:yes stop_codon:yes gene_type:complete